MVKDLLRFIYIELADGARAPASFSRREAQSSPVNLNANVQALTGIIVALAVVVIGE